eukprot:2567097-Pleurochrysis_carterae.AAC.1
MSSHPTPREASVRRRHQLEFSPPPRFNLDSISPPMGVELPGNAEFPPSTPDAEEISAASSPPCARA